MRKLGLWITLIYFSVVGQLQAALEIVITEGVDSARPIAVVPFKWEGDGVLPGDLTDVVMNDLRRSGKFNPAARSAMPEYPSTDSEVNYGAWAAMGIDTIVVGSVKPQSVDRYLVSFEIIDVLRGQITGGQSKVLNKEGGLTNSKDHIIDERQVVISGDDFRQYSHRISEDRKSVV